MYQKKKGIRTFLANVYRTGTPDLTVYIHAILK